jgi:hypothetical protein
MEYKVRDQYQQYPESPYKKLLVTAQSINILLTLIVIAQLIIMGFLIISR